MIDCMNFVPLPGGILWDTEKDDHSDIGDIELASVICQGYRSEDSASFKRAGELAQFLFRRMQWVRPSQNYSYVTTSGVLTLMADEKCNLQSAVVSQLAGVEV